MVNNSISQTDLRNEINKRNITKMYNDNDSYLHKRKYNEYNEQITYNDILKQSLHKKINTQISLYEYFIIKNFLYIVLSIFFSLYLMNIFPYIGIFTYNAALFYTIIIFCLCLSFYYNINKIIKYQLYIKDIKNVKII